MRKIMLPNLALVGALLVCTSSLLKAKETVSLGDLDLKKVMQGWGSPHADKSVDNHPLSIGGQKFEKGLGTHAASILYIDVQGVEYFAASVGVDDEVRETRQRGVCGLWRRQSAVAEQDAARRRCRGKGGSHFGRREDLGAGGRGRRRRHQLRSCRLGRRQIRPYRRKAENHRSAARRGYHSYTQTRPQAADQRRQNLRRAARLAVHVHHRRDGQPAHRFRRRQSAGRPGTRLRNWANHRRHLEKAKPSSRLQATNELGVAQRKLKIVCGPQLALTPPMGWNSWNCFAGAVDDAKVRSAADAMVNSGLVNYGWTYINIDDCWEMKGASRATPKA